jgi:hypothetical protein
LGVGLGEEEGEGQEDGDDVFHVGV